MLEPITHTYVELIAKLATLAGTVFALYRFIFNFAISKKSRLREEFKFVKAFIADLKLGPPPILS